MFSKGMKWTLGLLFVLAVAGLAFTLDKYVFIHKSSSLPGSVSTQPNKSENNTNGKQKTSSSPITNLSQGSSQSSTQTSNTSVNITRVGVINSTLQVGTLLDGITSGSCTLTVSQSGQQSITVSDNVVLQNNSYVCPVFSVALSKFPNLGLWNVEVGVSFNGTTDTASWVNNPVDLSQ